MFSRPIKGASVKFNLIELGFSGGIGSGTGIGVSSILLLLFKTYLIIIPIS